MRWARRGPGAGGTPAVRRYPKVELIRFGTDLMLALGAGGKTARIVAETAAETEAMGINTHGLAVYPYYDAMVPDPIDPAARPEVVRETGASCVIDGRHGCSQPVLHLAGEIARRKAAEQGVAMVGIRRVSWLGALAAHLLPLVRSGFMAQLWVQTTTAGDAAPFGGREARLATNPVALAFPTAGDPVVSDFSTASISTGKTRAMAERGEKTAEPLFLDRGGKPSRDPRTFLDGGTILPLGGLHYGFRGYALSLWCEATVALSGGECHNPDAVSSQSANLTVIDPEAFGGREQYLQEIERFKRHVLHTPPRPGFDRVRLPGERLLESLRRSEERGVAVEASMAHRLEKLASKYGVAPPVSSAT